MSEWVPWSKAQTFEEWVIMMIEEKRTKEPEFQAAIRYHGKEKLREIWKRYQEKKDGK